MRYLKFLALVGIAAAISLVAIPSAHAQRIQFGVGIGPGYVGPPPVCPYGYYDYYPYQCAPYGYWGPSYFSNGVFLGVGPWARGYYDRDFYHGRPRFDRDFDGRGRGFVGRDRDDRSRAGEGFRGGDNRGGDRGRGFSGGEGSRGGGNSRSGGNEHGGGGGRGHR